MTRFILPIEPMPAARPRARKGGHGYYPARYASWLEAAALLARRRGGTHAGPVRVGLVLRPDRIVVEIEPSDAQRGKFRFDIDNAGKAILDCLTRGGVLVDDSQVVELSVRMNG